MNQTLGIEPAHDARTLRASRADERGKRVGHRRGVGVAAHQHRGGGRLLPGIGCRGVAGGDVVGELMEAGTFGLLVDYPAAEATRSAADERALGLRATVARYPLESIINWRAVRVGAEYRLVLVVLGVFLGDRLGTMFTGLYAEFSKNTSTLNTRVKQITGYVLKKASRELADIIYSIDRKIGNAPAIGARLFPGDARTRALARRLIGEIAQRLPQA